ncbi:putative membrane protein [Pseudozyma hubeiensis]|nr:putative membrane protein [Pseudozyma hubeiensis]
MASYIANKVTKRFVSGQAKKWEPEDPLYEFYTAPNGKQKRRKRALPPGLTRKQAKLLKKIKKRAHYLDKGFHLCGMRFGWTFFIGIVPGLGDLVNAILNHTLVVNPVKKDFDERPDWLIRQMVFNNAVSTGVGFVPLAGDVIMAAWKTNSRNARLLEELMRLQGEENIAKGLPDLTPRSPNDPQPLQNAAQKYVQGEAGGAATAGANASVGNSTSNLVQGSQYKGTSQGVGQAQQPMQAASNAPVSAPAKKKWYSR